MKFTDEISDLIYQEYLDIEPKAYQDRIRFFDYNKKAITQLDYEMRLEISLEYTVALFEVGEYAKYLKNVDQLLAITIQDNLYSLDGDDIYQELLFRKACSLHNTVDYAGAEHVFSELIRIDKDNSIYQRAYKKNQVQLLRYNGQKVRAAIIGLLMLTGLLIGAELLVVRHFFQDQIGLIEFSRNGLFLLALLGIVAQEFSVRIQSYLAIRKLRKK